MNKKLIFTIIFSCVSTLLLFAQDYGFAVIYDKDGWCNVRSEAKIGDNIIAKLYNGDIVYLFDGDSKDNWQDVDAFQNSDTINIDGTVYHDRIRLVEKYFPKIPAFSKTENEIIFSNKNIKIVIKQQNFNATKHSLSYNKTDDYRFLEKIDNQHFWGTDGEIPKREYQTIDVYFNDTKVSFPKNAYSNLFEPNFNWIKINYDKENDILYIQSMNGDGAGGYVVLWVIEKGKYKRRCVCHGF